MRKLNNKEVDDRLKGLPVKRVGDYQVSSKKSLYKCLKCKSTFKAFLYNLTRGFLCPYCSKTPPVTPEVLNNKGLEMGFKIETTAYKNNTTNLPCTCFKCKTTWEAKWVNIIQGSTSCPICRTQEAPSNLYLGKITTTKGEWIKIGITSKINMSKRYKVSKYLEASGKVLDVEEWKFNYIGKDKVKKAEEKLLAKAINLLGSPDVGKEWWDYSKNKDYREALESFFNLISSELTDKQLKSYNPDKEKSGVRMSLCHKCPYKIKTLDSSGNLVFTPEALQIIDESPEPYNDLPCSSCELGFTSGSDYHGGQKFVSLDAQDFDSLACDNESLEEELSGVDGEALHKATVSGVILVQRTLRALDIITRDVVESKLEHPDRPLRAVAQQHGISTQAAHSRLLRALKDHPILATAIQTSAELSLDLQLSDDDLTFAASLEEISAAVKPIISELWKYSDSPQASKLFKLTSKTFPPAKRDLALPFSFFYEVAPLELSESEKRALLERAELYRWKLKDLKKAIRDLTA